MKKILEERLPYLPLQTCKVFKDQNEAHLQGNLSLSWMESSYCKLLNECFPLVVYDGTHKENKRPDFDFKNEKLFLEVKSNLQTLKDIEKSYNTKSQNYSNLLTGEYELFLLNCLQIQPDEFGKYHKEFNEKLPKRTFVLCHTPDWSKVELINFEGNVEIKIDQTSIQDLRKEIQELQKEIQELKKKHTKEIQKLKKEIQELKKILKKYVEESDEKSDEKIKSKKRTQKIEDYKKKNIKKTKQEKMETPRRSKRINPLQQEEQEEQEEEQKEYKREESEEDDQEDDQEEYKEEESEESEEDDQE